MSNVNKFYYHFRKGCLYLPWFFIGYWILNEAGFLSSLFFVHIRIGKRAFTTAEGKSHNSKTGQICHWPASPSTILLYQKLISRKIQYQTRNAESNILWNQNRPSKFLYDPCPWKNQFLFVLVNFYFIRTKCPFMILFLWKQSEGIQLNWKTNPRNCLNLLSLPQEGIFFTKPCLFCCVYSLTLFKSFSL